MAGHASIVGAAESSVGKVRAHNEDSYFIDPEAGIFLVCDGMGGHAAGEVASALAVSTIRDNWLSDATQAIAEQWLALGTPDAHRRMMAAIHDGAHAAHDAILDEATRDRTKGGMGTTLVGAMVIGGEIVFAHCGDSRAYLVRDGIAMQLTEDHTLLARLLAAGVDVDVEGDGARFKSMLTNALGIGHECKVATFVVPLADGDRFLLCSDGITEYIPEPEIGEVLCKQPSPARAAQRLVELALQRGGADNATALVVRVLEAGDTARPAEVLRKEQTAIDACPLWAKITPQQRLRALRIALPRDHAAGDRIAAQTLGDRVAWIIVEGEATQEGMVRGPGSLLYPEALLADRPLPDRDGLAVASGELRTLALRADDFHELCEDDAELAEALLEALAAEIAARGTRRRTGKLVVQGDADAVSSTDPGIVMTRAKTPLPISQADVEADAGDEPDIEISDDESSGEDGAIPEPVASDPESQEHAAIQLAPEASPPAPLPPPPSPPKPSQVTQPLPVVHIPIPASPRRAVTGPLGTRPSSERLILEKEERAAAAADLEDALTKLTVDDGWGESDDDDDERFPDAGHDEPTPQPEPLAKKARAPLHHDYSEPEISIEESELGLEAAEVSVDAADLPDAAVSGQMPAMLDTVPTEPAPAPLPPHADEEQVVEMEADEPPDPEEPPPDSQGEEPEEIVMTVDDDEDDEAKVKAAPDRDGSAPVTEPINDNSSPILTLTVDD